ncbi:MAG: isoprenyl transferase [Proteobacteria bacterium]|nr:isoprenyl transferase [Pseudomonadota bacterium]
MDAAHAQPAGGASAPAHVAIIMDGNGRWAKARGLPRTEGHRRGAESVRVAIESAMRHGVRYLTLFGFSSENWKRPKSEVTDLMGLLRIYLRREIDQLDRNGVRVRFIGDRTKLDSDIVATIVRAENRTEGNVRLDLIIALSYGGRDEIVEAARRLAADVAEGRLKPDEIDERAVEAALYTSGIPDPDVIVRTSGEKRISNFLLWQSAYAEFLFVDTLWPDFRESDFDAVVSEFRTRQRRYGATG